MLISFIKFKSFGNFVFLLSTHSLQEYFGNVSDKLESFIHAIMVIYY